MKQKLLIAKKETFILVFFGNLKDLTFGSLEIPYKTLFSNKLSSNI